MKSMVPIGAVSPITPDPPTRRQARLQRFGVSDATARAVALMAYGEPAEPWRWSPAEVSTAERVAFMEVR